MNIRCIKCKGRGHCGRKFCPIASKIGSQKRLNTAAKQDFFGAAPNVFIGRYGYPNINVGLLSTEDYNHHDAPLHWSANDYQIQQVIDLRTSLVNSTFHTNIKSFNDRMLGMSQEVSLSTKPVDVEINLEKKPFFRLSFNQDTMPHGPSVKLKKATIAENPKIPHKVDRIVSDYDLKAADAVGMLRNQHDEHYLTKVLSVGNLGVRTERKLVPTRWSITAVDDIIGKQLTDEIKRYPESDFLAFFGGYLGNYYLVLFFPNCWSYELFETVVGERTSFSTDHEFYNGRKDYADNTAGGYYAARHAILERLSGMKRQAGVLALRFITNEYWAPLGVWVVREATRNSMKSKPIEFGSKELMLKYTEAFIRKKFNFDVSTLLRQSKLLDYMKRQKRIGDFQS
ncbi:hypothetical protein KY363_01260 [Candidatus Woesearchaeota archaeon]|nr:hypothetical protein [Candidatus Woesearchaeota archaeon]